MIAEISIEESLIAPCGMNCAICIGHMRERNPCDGCNGKDEFKPKHCVICRIKNCEMLAGSTSGFCFECNKFPCTRLKQLDKRYRAKYAMSMIENLQSIQAFGLKNFVNNELVRWKCPQCGELLCVHREDCPNCHTKRAEE